MTGTEQRALLPELTRGHLPRQAGPSRHRGARPVESHDLLVAANRLPRGVTRNSDELRDQPDSGGLASALSAFADLRAGWVGAAPGSGSGAARASGVSLLPLSPSEQERYARGLCSTTLWPLLHQSWSPPRFRWTWWQAYREVNARFAAELAHRATPDGHVWVHDYQLALVPGMLRSRRPDLNVAFFLHTPFPPVDVLRRVPVWEDLMVGLLGSDLLGFQTAEDVESFLGACARLDAVDVVGRGVVRHEPSQRTVRVGAYPISVDAESLERIAERPEVIGRAAQIRRDLGSPKTLLLGVDRLDYTKGIPQRLRAVRSLLDDGTLGAGDATYVQVAPPTRVGVPGYEQLRDDVEREVGRTLGEHAKIGAVPVHYLRSNLEREEIVALYLAADVMLVTPLRDGMNLVAKEYVAARRCSGALVLSETAGAARELGGAWLADAGDPLAVADAVRAALAATPEERRRRMTSMSSHVRTHDVRRWASEFLGALGHEVELRSSG